MSPCPSLALNFSTFTIDVAGSRLIDTSTLELILSVSSVPASKTSELYAALLSTAEEFRDLLAEYSDVISSQGFSATVPKHLVCHSVPTTPGPPVFAKARRLDAEKLQKIFCCYGSCGYNLML